MATYWLTGEATTENDHLQSSGYSTVTSLSRTTEQNWESSHLPFSSYTNKTNDKAFEVKQQQGPVNTSLKENWEDKPQADMNRIDDPGLPQIKTNTMMMMMMNNNDQTNGDENSGGADLDETTYQRRARVKKLLERQTPESLPFSPSLPDLDESLYVQDLTFADTKSVKFEDE